MFFFHKTNFNCYSNRLFPTIEKEQETSGSFSLVTSTPLGVVVCLVLHSCSQLCPKVWQALVGSQTDAGAFLDLGVCWRLALWQEEKKPEQSAHCVVFLHFLVNAWIAKTTLLVCNYLLWNAFVIYVIRNLFRFFTYLISICVSLVCPWILANLTPIDFNLSPSCEEGLNKVINNEHSLCEVLSDCHGCVKSCEVASVYLVWSHSCPQTLASYVGALMYFSPVNHLVLNFTLLLFCIKKNFWRCGR